MKLARIGFQLASAFAIFAVLGQPASAQVSRRSADPVTADAVRVDTAYPPRAAELAIRSQGSRLNVFLYVAGGEGPHPTVILLHGFPGNERNGDLAQAFRRAGMNALLFSYRGAWGNGGTFSFAHALEDVQSAIDFVRSDSSVAAFGVDPHRVILVGHSMGGWLALMGSAAAGSSVACTVALDFWNVGADGGRMKSEPDTSLTAYVKWVTEPGAPLRADNGWQGLVAEMKEHADEWNPEQKAAALARRPALLIAADNVEAHSRLAAALQAAHARQVTALQWKTDHSFSGRRIHLARTIVEWLRRRC
jgi:pimeloyl-ACP methyl ester carboxylesterase